MRLAHWQYWQDIKFRGNRIAGWNVHSWYKAGQLTNYLSKRLTKPNFRHVVEIKLISNAFLRKMWICMHILVLPMANSILHMKLLIRISVSHLSSFVDDSWSFDIDSFTLIFKHMSWSYLKFWDVNLILYGLLSLQVPSVHPQT